MITTIVSLRAKGIGWTKLNLFVHSIMAASLINLFGVPALLGAIALLFTDKYLGTNFSTQPWVETHYFSKTFSGSTLTQLFIS
jgi:heme/copper-type cytochrome/quinol oxidase subunit 1